MDASESEQILETALSFWGEGPQFLMLVEESQEFNTEILHHLRGRPNLEHLVEEREDLEIMLGQFDKAMERRMGHEAYSKMRQTIREQKLTKTKEKLRQKGAI